MDCRCQPRAPDLAIEAISPSDADTDVEEKVSEWLAAGTLAVVVIDSRRSTAKVHRPAGTVETLAAGDTLSIPDVLPGWSLELRRLFG
jgi:Uma2 family endonuclease